MSPMSSTTPDLDPEREPYDRWSTRRLALGVLLTLWLFATIHSQVGALFRDVPVDWQSVLISEGSFTALGLVFCAAVFFIIERIQKLGTLIISMAILITAAGAANLHFWVYLQVLGVLGNAPNQSFFQHFYSLIFWFHFYIAWCAIALAILLSAAVKVEHQMRARAEALAHRARMVALRYQLNPHFLFNALNSLAALILDRRDEAAERMITRLAAFLKRGLAEHPFEEITLEREIEHQVDYLAVEAERFSDRLTVEYDVPESLASALVPGFILQPIVENAVKHGVAASSEPVCIRISAQVVDERLQLNVSENSPPKPSASSKGAGIGHRNVQERLAELYAGAADFISGFREKEGYVTQILIPLRPFNQSDEVLA